MQLNFVQYYLHSKNNKVKQLRTVVSYIFKMCHMSKGKLGQSLTKKLALINKEKILVSSFCLLLTSKVHTCSFSYSAFDLGFVLELVLNFNQIVNIQFHTIIYIYITTRHPDFKCLLYF